MMRLTSGRARVCELRPEPLGSDWALLWVTGSFGALGASVSTFALPIAVFSATKSVLSATVIITIGMIAGLATTALGGALIDRSNKRSLLIACNITRAIAYAVVAFSLLIGDAGAIILPVFAYAMACIATALATPTTTALLRDIVSPSNRVRAASLNQARQGAATTIGPPIAGSLMAISHAAPFVLDALAYLISSFGIALIRTKTPPVVRRDVPYLKAAAEGFAYCWNTRPLSRIILFGMLSSFCAAGMILSINLSLAKAGVKPALIGIMNITVGVATVLGASLTGPATRQFRASQLIPVASIATAISLIFLCVSTNDLFWLAGFAGAAFLPFPLLTSLVFGYLASTTPRELQGRVNAAGGFSSMAMTPLAPLFVGALMQAGASTEAIRVPLVTIACVGLLMIISARRNIEQD